MKAIYTAQAELFGTEGLLPPGLKFAADFIALDEEAALLAVAESLPLREARWGWQHSAPPVPALRYSVTMRTVRPPPEP